MGKHDGNSPQALLSMPRVYNVSGLGPRPTFYTNSKHMLLPSTNQKQVWSSRYSKRLGSTLLYHHKSSTYHVDKMQTSSSRFWLPWFAPIASYHKGVMQTCMDFFSPALAASMLALSNWLYHVLILPWSWPWWPCSHAILIKGIATIPLSKSTCKNEPILKNKVSISSNPNLQNPNSQPDLIFTFDPIYMPRSCQGTCACF